LFLSHRAFTNISRDPTLLGLTFTFTILSAIILGGVFYQLNNEISGSQDRVGFFFFFLVFFFSLLSLNSLSLFLAERRLFIREQGSLFYSTIPFLVSKLLCDMLPLRVIPPLIFGSISYWMIGLQSDPLRFVTFLVILVLVNVVATSACFAISAAFSSPAKANLVAVIFFVFSMLFGGLFINFQITGSTMRVIASFRFVSFFHYGFNAFMVNEFTDLTLLWTPINGDSFEMNGGLFLQNLAIDTDNFGTDVMGLGVMALLFQLIAVVYLKYFQKTPR